MRDILHTRQGDDFEQTITPSLSEALETILKRSVEGDRLGVLQTLRSQMERVLAEAPIRGDLVKTIAWRSDLAALFEAEFARKEAAETERG